MYDFSNQSSESRYLDDLSSLLVGEMKDEMGDVAVEELVGLKLKVNSNLVNNSNEYKKGKGYTLFLKNSQ